jgi:hypothetical protein
MALGTPGYTEGAGAIVEADGRILIGPNGYPVYASVHMNGAYFAAAKQNLIATGGYTNEPPDSFFPVGAAVFKATWMRLDPGQAAPQGAFTTQAQVPILTIQYAGNTVTILPAANEYTNVTVALVGLHVVGQTINHPEFLWGTFEHKHNAPAIQDNCFTANGSSPDNYTFYAANTPFSLVNSASFPPALSFSPANQRFAPINNIVLENRTGGENLKDGPANIASINASAQSFLRGLHGPQSAFANYNLIGTVWMPTNSFTTNSDQNTAVGSVNLANTTAETYVQIARNTPANGVQNCFLCHNGTAYSFRTNPPPLLPRRIALSYVLGVGTPYAVANQISGDVENPQPHVGEVELRRKRR